MSHHLVNPFPRLGDPFQLAGAGNAGMPFTNRTGATISKGQVAAIDLYSSNSGFADLCPVSASSQKFPLVLALADVTSGTTSNDFLPQGVSGALILTGITKGKKLGCDYTTNSTGGTSLIAFVDNASMQSVGLTYESSNGTGTLTMIAFDGITGRVGGGWSTGSVP